MRKVGWLVLLSLAGLLGGAEPQRETELIPEDREEMALRAKELFQQGEKFLKEDKADLAARRCREALELRRRLYPPDSHPHGHKDLAATLRALGCALVESGRPEEALG